MADIEAGTTAISDKAYNTNDILRRLADAGATTVIPTRSNRAEPQMLDPTVYATRKLVDTFFRRNKALRRVPTR